MGKRGGLAIMAAMVLALSALVAEAPHGVAAPTPQLSGLRAAAHPGYDRLVFQFTGPIPAVRRVAWVPRVTEDPSGRPVALGGRAFLRVSFQPATAHTPAGSATYAGRLPTTFDLPVLRSVRMAGDFEHVLSFGIGLWQRTRLHVFTLSTPSRLVIDMTVPSGGPGRLDAIDDHRLVYLDVGDAVRVALRTCVSCGESWRILQAPSPRVVRIEAATVVPLPHPPGIVGFPYESRWTLRATGAGCTSLQIDELPPQRGAPPLSRYVLRFVVSR